MNSVFTVYCSCGDPSLMWYTLTKILKMSLFQEDQHTKWKILSSVNKLMAFIADFPLIHSTPFIKKEVINTYSLLYTVEGTTKGKLPYLLASHLDVVPVDPSAWEVPPFSGKIVNRTYIYGRGAVDDKSGVLVSQINKVSSAWFDKSQRTVVGIAQFYYAWIPCYAADCTALCPATTDLFTYHFITYVSHSFNTIIKNSKSQNVWIFICEQDTTWDVPLCMSMTLVENILLLFNTHETTSWKCSTLWEAQLPPSTVNLWLSSLNVTRLILHQLSCSCWLTQCSHFHMTCFSSF